MALVYLALFSSVGLGNRSGVNRPAFFILPLIFILPWMNAIWGLSLPRQTYSKSLSVMVKVASAFLSVPTLTAPLSFLRSIIHVFWMAPPFLRVMLKL